MSKKVSSISDVYSSVLVRKAQRSKFNMNHTNVLSTSAGVITPILCVPCLPGDVWSVRSEIMIKAAPMIAPIMDRVDAKIEFWKVYNRTIFPKWSRYINPSKEEDENLVLPYFEASPFAQYNSDSSLWDYLGLPSLRNRYNKQDAPGINALPFLAYQFIWNEFYRDPNLQDEVVLPHMINPLYDGNVTQLINQEFMEEDYIKLFQLRNRCWQKDYFTTSQPNVQRGDDVMLNLNGSAVFNTNNIFDITSGVVDPSSQLRNYDLTGSKGSDNQIHYSASAGSSSQLQKLQVAFKELNGKITMDSGISINDLRELSTLQRYKERLQLIGDRYVDWLLGMWGVRSSDARLQRPEFVGGGRVPITVGEVLQTSNSVVTGEDLSAQGNQSGNFFALSSTPRCHTFFEEHGYLIGVLTIMPRTSYFQGVPRHFMVKDRYDFALPMFANLGEQEVRLNELYCHDSNSLNVNWNETFGYQQRYAEYKSIPNQIHGSMRSSLDYWHWARKFETDPKLSSEFVKCNPDKRIFAVTDDDTEEFYVQLFNNCIASRELPRVAVPTLR